MTNEILKNQKPRQEPEGSAQQVMQYHSLKLLRSNV